MTTHITPHTIFEIRDKEVRTERGSLLLRLNAAGWSARWTSPDVDVVEQIEGMDVWSACRFANDRIQAS